MLTDLLLLRAQLRPRLDVHAVGRVACWWSALRRGLRI